MSAASFPSLFAASQFIPVQVELVPLPAPFNVRQILSNSLCVPGAAIFLLSLFQLFPQIDPRLLKFLKALQMIILKVDPILKPTLLLTF